MLMEKLSTREWYNRVNEHLIIGALPFKSMAQLLVDEEVIYCHLFPLSTCRLELGSCGIGK